MSTTTEPAATQGHAIFDIEPVLHDMRTTTALLGHMGTSKLEVSSEQLHYIEDRLIEAHRKLEAMWKQVWDDRHAEHAQHAAELAAAKAEAAEAAPGSLKQIKQVQGMLAILHAGHRAALEQCDRIGDTIAEALAEREGAA